jgi:hypothetical protein
MACTALWKHYKLDMQTGCQNTRPFQWRGCRPDCLKKEPFGGMRSFAICIYSIMQTLTASQFGYPSKSPKKEKAIRAFFPIPVRGQQGSSEKDLTAF